VALAERLTKLPAHRRIDEAFALVFNRPPVERERAASQRFLAANPLREFTLALLAANDFLYLR